VEPKTTEDAAVLRALALAELASPQHNAEVDNSVKDAVRRRLTDLYRPVAKANYAKLAGMFDTAAKRFTECVAVIDPETAADVVVTGSEEQRAAWSTAPVIGADLDAALPVLSAAAALAGLALHPVNDVLPLSVDPDGLHRRRVWEAWSKQDGRTRRWGALVALGAKLRAVDLERFEPYRQPKPLEQKQEQVGRGAVRTYMVDPEDTPGQLPPIDPVRGDRKMTAV
jgi:hypothetical protein